MSERSTKEVTYVYDVFDRRIAKDVDDDGNGTIDRGETYVYDGADVALVFDETDALVERLLYGPGVDQPLASEDATGDVLWFLADNQGTIRDVAEYDSGTDTTTVVNHLTYGGFGNITSQTNSAHEPRHTYTGREWDHDADLFYYRARWYDPTVGRFISEDPIGFAAGDTNVVRYVGNAPTNFVDPSGLEESTGWVDAYSTWFDDTFGSGWSTAAGDVIYDGLTGVGIDNDTLAGASDFTLLVGTAGVSAAGVLGGYYALPYLPAVLENVSTVLTTAISYPTLVRVSSIGGGGAAAIATGGTIAVAWVPTAVTVADATAISALVYFSTAHDQ